MTPAHANVPHRHHRRLALALALVFGASPTASALAAAEGASAAPASHRVTAVLTDFHIALSQRRLSPGAYTFVATNKGQVLHRLRITGPALAGPATPLLDPGQSATLHVHLRKGRYAVFCPVANHRELGMDVSIVVTQGRARVSAAGTSAGGGTRVGTSVHPGTGTGSGGSTGGGLGY